MKRSEKEQGEEYTSKTAVLSGAPQNRGGNGTDRRVVEGLGPKSRAKRGIPINLLTLMIRRFLLAETAQESQVQIKMLVAIVLPHPLARDSGFQIIHPKTSSTSLFSLRVLRPQIPARR